MSLALMMVCAIQLSAQSPLGIWKTIDDTDNVAKSYIEIHDIDGQLYATIRELLPAADITHCYKCKGDKKDKPLTGMTLMRELKPNGDEWKGGYILDPASGKEYRCIISLDSDDKLKVRGYIGTPMLGRTQYWYRK